MDNPDESVPVTGDPAAVAETLQQHLGDAPDTSRVGALQPIVEAVAGWRDAASVSPDEWLAALEATPDVLFLQTDDGVIRYRPDVTGGRDDPEAFRLVRTGDDTSVEPLDREAAAAVLDDASVTIGVVTDLPVEVRARFLSQE
ncbi:hypothetical protein C499_18779 [Halogeometricum borinquense DSM 11551]|uniref:Uncharacterized protein n=2 Tax=Halogeometricum borinquense TaxID=60847 RepID=E4NNF5_HALBP|nr:hypothetical protein [Halogeometricum borinquense]ADQ67493.1 hypothetical protein Hbor_19260 [Halogeometricum borinquense DSM 11551]ELY23825.1 hypothetical protein C499_18779 [Halogeometricum borinquense DSM 11551]RYJ13532.1 hypothetical protein ELS19_05875 [Halogeometricum borinquense]